MFSAELFQNILMKSSVMEFSSVLAVDYGPVFYQKVAPPKGQFLEFVGGEIIHTKKGLWWIPVLVVTCNICKNKLIHRRCPSDYCE